jgi:glycerol-3-phosphate dehydrogenase subunit C
MGNISYQPTEGLCYDPTEEKYWDADALQGEITRIFEVCHGCRMCFKFCDSFPDLFSFIDERHDGDVTKLTAGETDAVMSSCFQCKLCEVECPYTPRDGHEFQLDFPKLVHRYTAQKAKREGVALKHQLLGNPDLAGSMARMSFGLANVMNRVSAHRWLMEKVLGVHRDKLLPDFAATTFEKWAKDSDRLTAAPSPDAEAVLFQTCYVQNNEPQIGRDACEVMDRNQV